MKLFSKRCPGCKEYNTEKYEYYWRCNNPPEKCDVATFFPSSE